MTRLSYHHFPMGQLSPDNSATMTRPGSPNAIRAGVASGVALQLREVRRQFSNGVLGVEDVSLDVPSGQFVAFLGPSGCGKSTLLRLIAGLDRASSGEIVAGSNQTPADIRAQRRIAFVFQDAHLLPWRSVLRNVTLPLQLAGVDRATRRQRAMQALEEVGLADAAARYPAQLSGGMRMRVSLARALVTQPKLLLLDEPFAALDELTRQRLDEKLQQLWLRHRPTVLFVTHSIAEAAFLAQRVVVFSPRPARIVGDHSLDLPEERRVELRTDPHFVAQTRQLYDSLVRGGAAGA